MSLAAIPSAIAAAPHCPRCAMRVYTNDAQAAINGRLFHRHCFKCSVCARQLSLSNFATLGDDLFCREHYGKKLYIDALEWTLLFIDFHFFKKKNFAHLAWQMSDSDCRTRSSQTRQ